MGAALAICTHYAERWMPNAFWRACILLVLCSGLSVFAFALGQNYYLLEEQERIARECQTFGHVRLIDSVFRCSQSD